MATFKAEIQNKRADCTYNVRIRITHNRVIRRLSTNIYVESRDVTKGLRIKNPKIIDQCNVLIAQCREACTDLGFGIKVLSADELADKLATHLQGGERFKLDFLGYMTNKAANMKKSTGDTYLNTVNALRRYRGNHVLDVADINVDFLRKFTPTIATRVR